MPATVITYTQTLTTNVGPPASYQVQATVTAAPNPGIHLFTYRRSDGLYDHVSTVLDVMTYPTASDPAFPYFRQSTVTFTSLNATEAVDFKTMVQSRLTSLAKEYDTVAATFVPGVTAIVVPV